MFKWIWRGILAVTVLGIVGVTFAVWVLSRSVPDYNRNLPDIGRDVLIRYDVNGIPHIEGDTDEDVYFGLGFAHAQDRIWQMEINRRVVRGRLSEIFGADFLATDKFMRALGLSQAAASSVLALDAQSRARLDAYVAGVNAFLETANAESRGRLAPEFFLVDNTIERWTAADTIGVVKLMAMQLSGKANDEILYAKLKLALEDARLGRYYPRSAATGQCEYANGYGRYRGA